MIFNMLGWCVRNVAFAKFTISKWIVDYSCHFYFFRRSCDFCLVQKNDRDKTKSTRDDLRKKNAAEHYKTEQSKTKRNREHFSTIDAKI